MPKQKLPNDHCTGSAKVCKTEMQNLSPVDQVQSKEILRHRLEEANLKMKKLQRALHQGKETNKTLCEYHDGKVKAQNEIVEKQNVSWRLMSTIQDQTNVMTDKLKRYQDSHEDLIKLHENLNLNQAKIKDSAKRFRDQIHDKKELKATLTFKTNQLSVLKNKHQQFENELMEKKQLLCTLNIKREDYEKTFLEKRKKHSEDVSELSQSIKYSEENLKTERERKNKLMAENNESSKRMEELFSKLQVLQLRSDEYKKQEEVLKSSTKMLKEKVTSLDNERNNLESEHLEIISKKNSEFSFCKKQLEDLKLMHTELVAKLKVIISENDELLKTTAKPIEDLEQLKNNLKNKDNELMKINSDLTNTLEKNEELSINILTLKEELIVKGEKICQLKANYESRKETVKKQINEQAEITKELAMTEQKLKGKSDDISDLLTTANDEKQKINEQIKELSNKVVKRNEKISNLKESLATLEQELKHDESRYNSEIQQKTDLAEQCKLLRHEEVIKELNTKIDILNRELSELKRVNTKKTAVDRKKKEEFESKLDELKLNFNEWNDKFTALQNENKALEEKLKNTKTLIDEKLTQEVEVIRKTNSLTRITNRENELSHSMPVKSPLKPILKSNFKDSPLKVQKVRFDSTSNLDIESIDGLEIMKEAERRFIDSTVSNRPNWANLYVPMSTEGSEELPFITTSQREEKNTDPFNDDSNDPYVFE